METSKYENLFNIVTTGEELWSENVNVYHPYQATDYSALDYLFDNYSMDIKDNVVDYGSGKGRLLFYINYHFNIKSTGVEMSKEYYNISIENRNNYFKKNKKKLNNIEFECCLAQDYQIKDSDNKFYFFNPFSVEIFMKIIDNILDSIYKSKRKVQLIIYYPSVEYVYYLEYCTSFKLLKDIPLTNLLKNDQQERFLIYELNII